MKPKISILTDPLPCGGEFFRESTRRIVRALRDIVHPNRKYFNHPIYRGHFAVTRSLVVGLRKIGVDFNYNPRSLSALADTVIVLAGVRTLRQAIQLKQLGQIKKIYAGPNIVVFSSDEDSLIASPEIDAVITPSDIIADLYLEDNPSLNSKIIAWPAGVDTDYWSPDLDTRNDQVIVFDKRQIFDGYDRVKPYMEFLSQKGLQTNHLVRSGKISYAQAQYREFLRRSGLMIGFTVGSESQGIAWTEAWSTDVPTLILRNNYNVYGGRKYSCSTAPYLTLENGLFFDDFDDFKVKFAYWQTHRNQFTPREWTIKHMSDEVCALQLYRKITEC